MATNLTWAGVTLANTAGTPPDVYRQNQPETLPGLDVRTVAFPFTAGREVQVLSSQQGPETSRAIAFDMILFKASKAAMNAFEVTVQAALAATAVGTLVFATPNSDTSTTWTSTRMSFIINSRTKLYDGTYRMRIAVAFEQFYGG